MNVINCQVCRSRAKDIINKLSPRDQEKHERTRANMGTCARMQCVRHSPSFHTQSGDWGKMHLPCTREKSALFEGAQLGMWPVYEVQGCTCRACDGGVTCCQVEVAACCVV